MSASPAPIRRPQAESRGLPPDQPDLFEPAAPPLAGVLKYQAEVLSPDEERALVERFGELDFKEYEFRGYLGKRRVVSFGWRYDYANRTLGRTHDLPPFLIPLRAAAARFAGLPPRDLQQALVTEYAPGAAIGWHKDRPDFADVIGISFLSPCQFRLRRPSGSGWERIAFTPAPRSAYLLRGPARTDWEHSIPAAVALRYSVTFRSLAAGVDLADQQRDAA